MDFFLQTLVKRKKLSQTNMIIIQQCLLMPMTSMATIPLVFKYVRLDIALLSMILMFINRKHDFTNTIIVYFVFLFIDSLYHV